MFFIVILKTIYYFCVVVEENCNHLDVIYSFLLQLTLFGQTLWLCILTKMTLLLTLTTFPDLHLLQRKLEVKKMTQ